MNKVYLSRRNLLTLLAKLDRVRANGVSFCTLIKSDTVHPKYPCTVETAIIAVEDEDYYTDRAAGEIYIKDDPSAGS